MGGDVEVKFARPPFNAVSDSLLRMYEERGLTATQFSGGWNGQAKEAEWEIRKTGPGDIIQMHIRTEHIENTRTGLALHAGSPLRFVTMSSLYQVYISDQEKVRLHKRR